MANYLRKKFKKIISSSKVADRVEISTPGFDTIPPLDYFLFQW